MSKEQYIFSLDDSDEYSLNNIENNIENSSENSIEISIEELTKKMQTNNLIEPTVETTSIDNNMSDILTEWYKYKQYQIINIPNNNITNIIPNFLKYKKTEFLSPIKIRNVQTRSPHESPIKIIKSKKIRCNTPEPELKSDFEKYINLCSSSNVSISSGYICDDELQN